MNSFNHSYDISLNKDKNESKLTELIEVKTNKKEDGLFGYSQLNNEDNNSANIKNDNKLVVERKDIKKINYRKGNLHTFFYDKNGKPRIVIGPDCK